MAAAVEALPGIAAVPPEWDGVFTPGPALQGSRLWFAATEEAALPAGSAPCYVAVRLDGRPAALVPLLAGPGGKSSLTTPYTLAYQPLVAPGLGTDAVQAAGAAFGGWCRRWPSVVLEALDPAWPGFLPFCAGMRRAGMGVRRFDQFGNWRQAVGGLSWDEYLQSRPGQLRETIRRKGKLAARDGVRFEAVQDPDGVAGALDAYEAIYARSWKVPEPFPRFNAALLRRAAAAGAARMGVMWLGRQAVAAQYWIVSGRTATVLKLAHDDAHKALSPGTLLTAHMVRRILEEGGVDALDFGRGDDGYKQLWCGERRQRVGLLLGNPWRLQGAVALLRQDLGMLRKIVRRR